MPPGLVDVDVAPGVRGWFTTRDTAANPPDVGHAANMSPYRPHEVARLAADRADVARRIGYPVATWHHMRQVHGASVSTVDDTWRPGTTAAAADGLVTELADRPLVVLVADCVPVLLATERAIGVVHVGRRGLVADALGATLAALPGSVWHHAVIGPSIRGCCYEVPRDLQEAVLASHPRALATTTWGTPAVDIAAAVIAQLDTVGARVVASDGCTRCDPEQRWFSHRADSTAGRFAGIVVRTGATASAP